MKLWEKENIHINKKIEKFTVGNDYILDSRLVPYDCQASIAHAKMLNRINIVDNQELKSLIHVLNKIKNYKNFRIKLEDEDCHTAIENYLIKKLGNVGKKIHTARSRNDQILTALRLYEKDEIYNIIELIRKYCLMIAEKTQKYGNNQYPGYTHMQKAMPITLNLWLGSFSYSMLEIVKILKSIRNQVDMSPSGSAAGFGIPILKIDKKKIANDMGFSKVIHNPMYCQLSRGLLESSIIHILTQIMYTLNKMASDFVIFSMDEFKYISIPKEFCTGSSIMPQKKNPDVLELIRAKYHVVLAEEFKVKSIISNLISGYNRDVQLTKQALFTAIDTTKECLEIMTLVLEGTTFNIVELPNEIFAVEEAYELVKQGIPFRDAYREISKKYK